MRICFPHTKINKTSSRSPPLLLLPTLPILFHTVPAWPSLRYGVVSSALVQPTPALVQHRLAQPPIPTSTRLELDFCSHCQTAGSLTQLSRIASRLSLIARFARSCIRHFSSSSEGCHSLSQRSGLSNPPINLPPFRFDLSCSAPSRRPLIVAHPMFTSLARIRKYCGSI